MKIVRYSHDGRIGFGVLEGDDVAELDGPPIGELRFSGKRATMDKCRLLAPVLPSKVVCIGVNYKDHAQEMGHDLPQEPLMFLKPATAVIGPGDPIVKPQVTQRMDFEGELVVVVQGLVRNADRAAAQEAILGYTVGCDVTARDLQAKDGQWTRAKGFDSFAPLGPWIETDLDASNLSIQTRLNGEVRQSSSTSNLIFDPASLVAYVSNVMTLLPGDCIFTGTPAGVGPMEPGDRVEVTIEGIGTLSNPVKAAR